jgi:hypothetical protein
MKKKLPIVNAEEEKTLMPEVLPAPPQPSLNGSPRQRTVTHMRKVLAAAAVAGIAATAVRTTQADDGGADASTDDGGSDSMFVGHDPGPDAGGPGDAEMDSMFIGHDPGPDAGGEDARNDFDSMFVGHDPGPDAGGSDNNGSSGGCSVGAVGRKGK